MAIIVPCSGNGASVYTVAMAAFIILNTFNWGDFYAKRV